MAKIGSGNSQDAKKFKSRSETNSISAQCDVKENQPESRDSGISKGGECKILRLVRNFLPIQGIPLPSAGVRPEQRRMATSRKTSKPRALGQAN